MSSATSTHPTCVASRSGYGPGRNPGDSVAGPGLQAQPPFRTVLAVGPHDASVAAATAVARLTGADVRQRRPAGRSAGRSIAMLARREAADLVVVTAGLGSSAGIGRLVRPALDSGFAMLVIPSGAPARLRLERIGVGYDGDPAARGALACAVDLVRLAGAAVASLDVAYVDHDDSPPDEPGARGVGSSRDAMIEWWLDSVGEEVPALVRPLRLKGDPAEALADLSLDLDLLVVGTRRGGRVRRLVAGSVSTRLLSQTRCPLLVVPEP